MVSETMEQTNQYLTFTLADEVFALEIDKVREVLDFSAVTRVPKMPEFMCGVINLRGNVVPVVDMRLKFALPQTQGTVDTCIIITEVTLSGESCILGALVDSVREVLDLEADQVEPPPRIGSKLNTDFIRGMGKHNGKFIILLDLDMVFSIDEINMIQTESSAERSEDGGFEDDVVIDMESDTI